MRPTAPRKKPETGDVDGKARSAIAFVWVLYAVALPAQKPEVDDIDVKAQSATTPANPRNPKRQPPSKRNPEEALLATVGQCVRSGHQRFCWEASGKRHLPISELVYPGSWEQRRWKTQDGHSERSMHHWGAIQDPAEHGDFAVIAIGRQQANAALRNDSTGKHPASATCQLANRFTRTPGNDGGGRRRRSSPAPLLLLLLQPLGVLSGHDVATRIRSLSPTTNMHRAFLCVGQWALARTRSPLAFSMSCRSCCSRMAACALQSTHTMA